MSMEAKLCRYCSKRNHYFLLCPTRRLTTNMTKVSTKTSFFCPTKYPVLMKSLENPGKEGKHIGQLLDLCSNDDYNTHKYTKKQNLHINPETINIIRINKKKKVVQNTIYKDPF